MSIPWRHSSFSEGSDGPVRRGLARTSRPPGFSAREAALHKQLYPDFLRLKAAGHRVQFRRARLFVDGQLWSLAMAPAAA